VAEPARLRGGRHGLSPEQVAAHQRARLLTAVAEVCAQRGYAGASVGAVVRRAGVSPRTFYRHFAGKGECFEAALEQAIGELEAAVAAAAVACEGEWPARAVVAVAAGLRELDAHATLARTVFVEALCAGEGALRVREAALARCRVLLPLPEGAPAQVAEAALGGVVETVYHALVEGRSGELAQMGDELTYCLLVGLVGHERALAAGVGEVGAGGGDRVG
jgi:AcrR family transcriptional regulator